MKTQKRFKSNKDNIFTEKLNKIVFSADDDKRIHSIDSIKTYAYGTCKDLKCKKTKINVTI